MAESIVIVVLVCVLCAVRDNGCVVPKPVRLVRRRQMRPRPQFGAGINV